MRKQRPVDPYGSPQVFKLLEPSYRWALGQSDVDVGLELVRKRCSASGAKLGYVIEMGCGGGRFTVRLSEMAARLLAIDPSEGMIAHCSSTIVLPNGSEFRCASAEELVLAGLVDEADLVVAFWSLTYAIQGFFDLVLDGNGVLSQQTPTSVALPMAQSFVQRLTQPAKHSRGIVAIAFQPDSIEQRWVTARWSEIGPFPGGARDFAWQLLEERRSELERDGHAVATGEVSGHLVCPDEATLIRVFLDHHLRGLIPPNSSRRELAKRLIEDMDEYHTSEGYLIPAGYRWLDMQLTGARSESPVAPLVMSQITI